MKAWHAAQIERERRFPARNREGYAGYVRDMADVRQSFRGQYQSGETERQATPQQVIATFDDLPPVDLTAPYDLSPADLALVSRTVQRKYISRFANIRRGWAILLQHLPELMADDATPQEVLEMSTAHGAILEILTRKGHRAVGTDYPNHLGRGAADSRYRDVNGLELSGQPDTHGLNQGGAVSRWPYQPIIDAIGAEVRLFDAGMLPYPLADASFDTVICLDAIEHYCHPRDWPQIVAELTRIARKSVLLILNPMQAQQEANPDYATPYRAFQRAMRSYGSDGFACVHAGLNRNELAVFKLMRLSGAPQPSPLAWRRMNRRLGKKDV